ncbi:hypothetical protein FAES_3275 [Fibrella aestuarina BUZ 2]|uniref:Uncharacterized protein n=1 Tax=Fibrella aestuarina BUZ 2 TaxID=1166018 RepID=I0KAY1_9BACT|nr:hypothetical protein [Fibrella aestuarina]CCH01284.1 hypothetical protein FAES_3275 [Fibrella aestuarina BUZ 2]
MSAPPDALVSLSMALNAKAWIQHHLNQLPPLPHQYVGQEAILFQCPFSKSPLVSIRPRQGGGWIGVLDNGLLADLNDNAYAIAQALNSGQFKPQAP